MNQPPDKFILVQEERHLSRCASRSPASIDADHPVHYARICLEAGCVGVSVQGYRNEGMSSGEGSQELLESLPSAFSRAWVW